MYGKIRAVAYHELVDKVMSEPKYKKSVRERKLIIIRRGGNGRTALVSYDAMADDIRRDYDSAYPHAEKQIQEQLQKQLASDIIRQDPEAVKFYRDIYPSLTGISLTDVKQEEYVLNARVMNEMVDVERATRSAHTNAGFHRPKIVWGAVMETCRALHRIHGHTLLPRSEARLKKKFNDYKQQGYIALVSGKVGNQNTRKINMKEARLLLKLRRSRVPVYTEDQIFHEYNRRALESGLNILKSPNSVRNFLYNPSVMPLWYSAVYGELEFRKKYSALLKTRMPQLRDSLWYGDGTKLNLYYRDANNKMCTTQVYEVMDAYSEVLLGYHISPSETFESQYKAFRMAVERAGAKPYEIVVDNQGGHKKLAAQGFFKKLCTLYRNTMPYNGQSKTIESVFGRMQQQIMHGLWGFTGQNITAVKKNSRPNMEFIEANRHALPTLDELKEVYARLREEWNNAAHPDTGLSRMDMYKESVNPLTVPVSELDRVQMFWLKSGKPVTYTNQGIEITINKVDYQYEVYAEGGIRDEEFAMNNTGRRFYVMYDPYDMTLVELWKEYSDGLVLAAQATPKLSIWRNTQQRTHEESVRMRAQLESNKATRAAIHLSTEDFDLEEQIAAELLGLSTPKLKGISEEAMGGYREAYEKGKLKSPIRPPGGNPDHGIGDEVPQSVGEWEKALSNATFDLEGYYNRG